MLTINNLEIAYQNKIALAITTPISFQQGDRIGIIGSNGAGKSTLIKALLGLIPNSGNIHSQITPENMAAHFQTNNYSSIVKTKIIIETILATKIKQTPELQELIEFFNFKPLLNKKFKQLSGGQQQRLTIILVLMQKAQLTFFDEVTSGLDFETRSQLISKLAQWFQNRQSTFAIVSHYYEELTLLTNKLLILEQGKVVAFGTQNELFQKYCGYSTIILNFTDYDVNLFPLIPLLHSPKNMIAFCCTDLAAELDIIATLVKHNINFKRSNNDIEIMAINAKIKEGF
ncbi:MAG: ATP-binding cassette domain-containing protein [Culicoidibacterales bacterium]